MLLIDLNNDDSEGYKILIAKIQSRHKNSTKYDVFIQYKSLSKCFETIS